MSDDKIHEAITALENANFLAGDTQIDDSLEYRKYSDACKEKRTALLELVAELRKENERLKADLATADAYCHDKALVADKALQQLAEANKRLQGTIESDPQFPTINIESSK